MASPHRERIDRLSTAQPGRRCRATANSITATPSSPRHRHENRRRKVMQGSSYLNWRGGIPHQGRSGQQAPGVDEAVCPPQRWCTSDRAANRGPTRLPWLLSHKASRGPEPSQESRNRDPGSAPNRGMRGRYSITKPTPRSPPLSSDDRHPPVNLTTSDQSLQETWGLRSMQRSLSPFWGWLSELRS